MTLCLGVLFQQTTMQYATIIYLEKSSQYKSSHLNACEKQSVTTGRIEHKINLLALYNILVKTIN